MPKKVLVVDNSLDDRETIKDVLRRNRYAVTTAANGRKALEIVKDERYDLIMMNIAMPKMSGYELLRKLRAKIKTKMVFVSMTPERNVDKNFIDGFIQKPFSVESLLNGVEKVLSR